jgi:hypothetical protein
MRTPRGVRCISTGGPKKIGNPWRCCYLYKKHTIYGNWKNYYLPLRHQDLEAVLAQLQLQVWNVVGYRTVCAALKTCMCTVYKKNDLTTVADPDPNPDPSYPYVFGPLGSGSGSISQRYWSRSGSFYHQAKIVRKILIPTVVRLLFNFLSLKNDVNVPSKSKKQTNLFFFN